MILVSTTTPTIKKKAGGNLADTANLKLNEYLEIFLKAKYYDSFAFCHIIASFIIHQYRFIFRFPLVTSNSIYWRVLRS